MQDQPNQTSPSSQTVPPLAADDEMSLAELWEAIVARKWLIFATLALFVGLAAAYVGLATTIYESQAMVQIGRIAGKPLDSGVQLASRLMNAYTPVNAEVAERQLPKLYSVTPDSADPSLLTLVARGRSPTEAQAYLKGVIDSLLAGQQKRFDDLVKVRQGQLAQLQAQYQKMNTALAMPDSRQASKGDSSRSALLYMEQGKRVEALTSVLGEIAKAQDELSPVNTAPTEMTRSPSLDPKPVAPRRLLIIVLAIVGGLMTGVFLALLHNAWSRSKAEGRTAG